MVAAGCRSAEAQPPWPCSGESACVTGGGREGLSGGDVAGRANRIREADKDDWMGQRRLGLETQCWDPRPPVSASPLSFGQE